MAAAAKLAFSAFAASTVLATPIAQAQIQITSDNKLVWDVSTSTTVISDGGQDAFDVFGTLAVQVSDADGSPLGSSSLLQNFDMTSLNTRSAASTASFSVPGPNDITVERSVASPLGSDYMRYVDAYSNAGSQTRHVTVWWGGALGSDAGTFVAATSSGDLAFDENDSWGVTIQGNSTAGPAWDAPVGYALGTSLSEIVTSVYGSTPFPSEDVGTIYFVTEFDVPAGATARVMYFLYRGLAELTPAPVTGISPPSGSQIAVVTSGIAELSETPWIGWLGSDEIASIVNWDLPDGAACTAETAWRCPTGLCVDGVCCADECGGGALDCMACSAAAGGGADGECTPLVADTASAVTCRSAAGACDAVEHCSPESTECPEDLPVPSSTVCRAALDACDAVETCDGIGVDCPEDEVLPEGATCRAQAGDCDVAEVCDGSGVMCPEDDFVPVGALCRDAADDCDAAEFCNGGSPSCPTDGVAPDGTSCSDGLVCNGDETCTAGVCESQGGPDCDDDEVCTTDACAEPGVCLNVAIEGCCRSSAECNDGDPCTDDTCSGSNECEHVANGACGGAGGAHGEPTDAGTAGEPGVAGAGPRVDAEGGRDAGAEAGDAAGQAANPRSPAATPSAAPASASPADGCACRASPAAAGGASRALALIVLVLARFRKTRRNPAC